MVPNSSSNNDGSNNRTSNKGKYLAIGLLVLLVGGSIAIAVFFLYNWEYVTRLEGEGYLGLFLISLLTGSPIPIPTPSMILTFTLGSILNPLWVGVVSGLGNALGYALIYLTGRGGHGLFSNSKASDWGVTRFLGKIKMPRRLGSPKQAGMVAIFLLAIYPNPFFTPMVFGLGAARFNFTRFFLACTAGKLVMSLILSYLGYLGLRSILHYFGAFHIPW